MRSLKATATTAVVLALVLAVPFFPVSAAKNGGGTSGPAPLTTDATRIVKMCYYVNGSGPYAIEQSESPGPVYHVGNGSAVIVRATGYFKGSGGLGILEIYDYSAMTNFVSKLVPSGKTVTATMPVAIHFRTGDSRTMAICVAGPGWAGLKDSFFQFECP